MKDIKQELEKLIKDYYQPNQDNPLFACIALSTDKEAILTLMEQAYNLGAESKWIPISESLPEVGEKVLVYFESGNILMGKLMNENKWKAFYIDSFSSVNEENPITHYQFLPQPPIV